MLTVHHFRDVRQEMDILAAQALNGACKTALRLASEAGWEHCEAGKPLPWTRPANA